MFGISPGGNTRQYGVIIVALIKKINNTCPHCWWQKLNAHSIPATGIISHHFLRVCVDPSTISIIQTLTKTLTSPYLLWPFIAFLCWMAPSFRSCRLNAPSQPISRQNQITYQQISHTLSNLLKMLLRLSIYIKRGSRFGARLESLFNGARKVALQ